MKIISVVGARPNFMKVAPIHKAINDYNNKNGNKKIEHLICHTGQHYDKKMSKIFFEALEMPKPDFYLGIGSGSHAQQTAGIMVEFEKVLLSEKPDLIVVVGDVNSTIACSLTAAKLGIKIAHVEAGLRSYDRDMPEELNRLLTDQLADYLFVTEKSGEVNLLKEGIGKSKIFFVGNVMIDSLIHYLPKVDSSSVLKDLGIDHTTIQPYSHTKVQSGGYILVTMHRPSNVDDSENLKQIVETLDKLAEHRKIVFPVHPRTMNNIKNIFRVSHSARQAFNHSLNSNLILTDPIGYIDFIALIKNAELIITDSGGIQEESTYLGVQCITVRNNTERPVTVDVGTNQLIGTDLDKVEEAAEKVLNGEKKKGNIPELWDGHAAERIVKILAERQ